MLKICKFECPYEFRIKTLEIERNVFHSEEIIIDSEIIIIIITIDCYFVEPAHTDRTEVKVHQLLMQSAEMPIY